MSSTATTPFSDRCSILSEFYVLYGDDPAFSDYSDYNNLGLPLAYFIAEGIVIATPKCLETINESWERLLDYFGATEKSYKLLDEVIG